MILGIDPGLENTGYAIIDEEKLVKMGTIKTKRTDPSAKRLDDIYRTIDSLIKEFRIREVAIETMFFAKNEKSAIKVSEAIGVLKLCGERNGLVVAEYTPLQVKMALVGYGRAEKEQVEIMVRDCLKLEKLVSPSHAADAAAVALTHQFTSSNLRE